MRILWTGMVAAALMGCPNPGGGGETDGGIEPCKPNPNALLVNGGFECGESPWMFAGEPYGTGSIEAKAGRGGGAAAKIVAGALGGRLSLEVATPLDLRTYCASAYVKGTPTDPRPIYMSVALAGENITGQKFSAPIDADWARVPPIVFDTKKYLVAELKTSKVILQFEMQSARPDSFNVKPGDAMYVDDVELWVSNTPGKCESQ